MCKKSIALFCTIMHLFCYVFCENIFTTMNDLKVLSELEDTQLAELEEHLRHSEERLEQIKRFVSELKPRTQGSGSRDALDVAGHPVDAFGLVKRWHHHNRFGDRFFPTKIKTACGDEHENCADWAASGECKNNPNYMLVSCKLACGLCDNKVYHIQSEMTAIIGGMRDLLPSRADVDGAADALLRLQGMYNLTASELRAGRVHGMSAATVLSAEDCLDIGHRATGINDLKTAIEWFAEAKHTAKTVPVKHAAIYHTAATMEMMNDALGAYKTAKEAFNGKEPDLSCVDQVPGCEQLARGNMCSLDIHIAQKQCPLTCGFCQPPLKTGAHHYDLLSILARNRGKAQEQMQHGQVKNDGNYFVKRQGYEELCQSTVLGNHTLYKNQRLNCKLISYTVPWVRFKLEVLSMSPFISVVYDVIHDAEAKHLQDLAKLRLDRSRVVLGEMGNNKTSKDRTSKQAYISDKDDPLTMRISKRIECITGLDTTTIYSVQTKHGFSKIGKSAESFQVVNYGMGGHYNLHHDFVQNHERNPTLVATQSIHLFGDRIATVMLYLNNVQSGGNTVFPKLNISITPVKNAAAFWYNAAPSGDYDDLTFHGGCPVLLGEKWIANKWVREFGNQLTRKCGLRSDSIQEI